MGRQPTFLENTGWGRAIPAMRLDSVVFLGCRALGLTVVPVLPDLALTLTLAFTVALNPTVALFHGTFSLRRFLLVAVMDSVSSKV